MSNANANAPKFVIGIDFGTTFTGACYALASESTEKPTIIPILAWPNNGKSIYPKVPTVSTYKKTDNGTFAFEKWGKRAQDGKVKPETLRLSRFKLLLDGDSSANSEFADELPLERLIADYLKKVVFVVKKDIDRKYPHSAISSDSFRYCLTIPAMWNDTAKAIMRAAAIKAGLITADDPSDKLILTSEPEAAALDCEHTQTEGSLQDEDVIFICDAGGGTIDLTVYKVHYKDGEKRFEELTRGEGKSCGSSFIDDLARLWFKGHLENIFGFGTVRSHELDEMALQFSTEQKIDFGSEEQDSDKDSDADDDDDDDDDDAHSGGDNMTITLPGSLLKLLGGENEYAQNDFIEDGKFKITQQQMKEFMFDPIVDQVLALIDGQLKRIPDVSSEKIKLFLVGGFGQSKYLEKRIREEFDDTNRVKMLFVPSDGGLSITRGAVLYGLNPDLITHRVCRRSYGVRCNRSFREGIDKEEYRIKGRDNKMRCKNRMDFFVNKNTQIKSSHFVERDYYAFYPDNPNSVLYAYDKDGNPPDYVTDDGIVKVSKLNIIMPEIPGKKSNEKIRYKTKIYLGLTEVKFEVDICGITRTYSANLDESEDSGSIQPKSQKKPNSPGFENIIAHFRKLGYNKTDRYKERAQIASEYIQKPKETGTVRRPPRDVRNKGKTKNTDNVATTSAPSTSQYLQPGEIAKMPEITEPA